MTGRIPRIACWTALGVVLAVTGYLVLNTTFMPYDDEGFLLISLRNYLAGLRLYDDVFSQYGPWPYVYHQVLTTVAGHAELTHTFGRAVTLAHWVAMSLLGGGIAWRLTRSHAAAGLAAVLTFTLTWQNISEPTHPGSHIGFLVALAGLFAALLPESRRPGLLYAGLGTITALLLLTKINVGLFLATGVGGFALQHIAWPARARRLPAFAAVGLLALPWVLLGRQLHLPWALVLAGQFTLAAAGLLALTGRSDPAVRLTARAWPVAVVAALAAGGVICAWVLARGTTPGALAQNVLLQPLRMPARFVVGAPWYAESLALAAASLVAAGRAALELRAGRTLSPLTRGLVAGIRLLALGWLAWHAAAWSSYYGIFHFAADCLPLLPAFLVPLASATPRDRLVLAGVAWIALPQVLHLFPVAGSQMAWATFLMVPLLVAGWWDLGRALPDLLPAGRFVARTGAAALAVVATFILGLLAYTGWTRYQSSRPLDLPGAEDIRLVGSSRQAIRLLTLNASIHADLLITRQGMYSYNLWSGVPTPTAQNATHWFWLLDAPAQQAIIARLAATPRTALIVSHSLDAFMADNHIPVAGPLQDYLVAHYQPLFRYGDFSFLVPTGSRAVPFGRFVTQRADSADTFVPPVRFQANVLLDGVLAHLRLEPLEAGHRAGPELLAAPAQVFAEPIDRDGQARGPTVRLPLAQPLRGLFRLTILAPLPPPELAWQDCALVARDADGRLLCEAVAF